MRRVLVCTLFAACAGGEMTPTPPSDPPYVLPTPELVAIAPGQMALGDIISVIGKDLVDPDHGNVVLHLVGTYTDETAARNDVDKEVPLSFVNHGQGKFEFGPNIWFSPSGDLTGQFHGRATLVNRRGAVDSGSMPEEHASGPIDVNLRVLPSVMVDRFHSVDQNCQGVSQSTIGGTNLAIGAEAVGIGSADSNRPLRFTFHIISPQVMVQYVRNEWYQSWPIMPTAYGSPMDGPTSFSTTISSGKAVFIDPTSREEVFQVNPPVPIAQQEYSEVKMYKLMTGPVLGPGPQTVTLVIEVDDDSGSHAQRQISVDVYSQGEIRPYDGNTRVLERYAPQLVSACFAGGDIGRDLTYTEGQSETRTRGMSYRWDINMGVQLGLTVGYGMHFGVGGGEVPISFGEDYSASISITTTWSQTFGEDVSASVSTEHHTGENLTAHILPTYFGVCYRQTERIERSVDLIFHNACGKTGVVGKAVLTDWNWGFDIATGPTCPPPTNLPGPQVFPP